MPSYTGESWPVVVCHVVAPEAKPRGVVLIADHAIQHARAEVLAAHPERNDVEIARNLRIGHADEAEGRIRLQQDLLIDVDRRAT